MRSSAGVSIWFHSNFQKSPATNSGPVWLGPNMSVVSLPVNLFTFTHWAAALNFYQVCASRRRFCYNAMKPLQPEQQDDMCENIIVSFKRLTDL